MYHCHLHLYLVGHQRGTLEQFRKAPPLKHFTHTFLESDEPRAELTAQADVILADLTGMDAGETLQRLAEEKRPEAELILLASQEQAGCLGDRLAEVTDVWILPMSEEMARFRFLKWQRDCRQGKELWETGHFLDAAIDSSPNLIWYKDKNGIHEKVNDSFCQTVNKTKKQVEGRDHCYIWDVEHDDPACIESEREVMQKRKTCVSDEVIQTGEGTRLLTTYKSPLYDLDGSVMGTVGVAVDVSRERAYEQEIIEKKRTLELLFSTMDCGVMCHTVDGKRIISVNSAALRLLGYPSQEELLRDGFELVAQSVVDEDKGKLRDCIRSLKKEGDSATTEYRVRHRDGQILHILGNVKLIRRGGELFYQRFLLDFTAQKLREEEKWEQKNQQLQYQEQIFEIFFNLLSDNVDDIYMMLDGTGETVEFASSNVERVLGIPMQDRKELLHQLGQASYLSGRKVEREDLQRLQPGMRLEFMETERINRKTGEHRWFRENVYCVSVQGVRKIVVYISDRTRERKTQDALAEALDMAQVANRAKSIFLSNVSHDIRTPMNAIMGFTNLLRSNMDDSERVLEYTRKISAASEHLLGLINDVLDMNKIESGIAVLNIDKMELAEVINEVTAVIRPRAKAKNQSFEVFSSAVTCEHLLGDKLRINQILINILSNAVKYTQPGGQIEMWVNELPRVEEGYSHLQFVVRDNGQGMSREYQQIIFDPFTREQRTTLNKVQGTGLGMAITKNLVELMNGSVQVESEPGVGSTFTVELDLRIQERADAPGFWKKAGVARMIVADGNRDICQDIARRMEGTGVAVHCAAGGTEATEMICAARERGEPYDLILLDWNLPDLDGAEMARRMQKEDREKTLILLSAACGWKDIEQVAQQAGIGNFLPKPFFMGNFRDAVQRMTGGHGSAREDKEDENALAGKHILVVDDLEVNRMLLVKLLTTLGARCEAAENGQEAISRFERARPGECDVILMDVQMPVMNGYEAAKAIRASAHPMAKKTAIIAITSNVFEDNVRSVLEAGMDACVSKPIVLEQLKRTIREVLQNKAAQ